MKTTTTRSNKLRPNAFLTTWNYCYVTLSPCYLCYGRKQRQLPYSSKNRKKSRSLLLTLLFNHLILFKIFQHLHKKNVIVALWLNTLLASSVFHSPLLRKDVWATSLLIKKSKKSKILILLILWLIEMVYIHPTSMKVSVQLTNISGS